MPRKSEISQTLNISAEFALYFAIGLLTQYLYSQEHAWGFLPIILLSPVGIPSRKKIDCKPLPGRLDSLLVCNLGFLSGLLTPLFPNVLWLASRYQPAYCMLIFFALGLSVRVGWSMGKMGILIPSLYILGITLFHREYRDEFSCLACQEFHNMPYLKFNFFYFLMVSLLVVIGTNTKQRKISAGFTIFFLVIMLIQFWDLSPFYLISLRQASGSF